MYSRKSSSCLCKFVQSFMMDANAILLRVVINFVFANASGVVRQPITGASTFYTAVI